MQVLTDLKQRGVADILICCVDGLEGVPRSDRGNLPGHDGPDVHRAPDPPFAEVRAAPPIRQLVNDLKPIYTASGPDAAMLVLEAFEGSGQQLPVIGQAWRDAWEHVIPFMAFPDEVRRVIYTTNAIEALNRQLRRPSRPKAASPARTSPAS